MHINNIYQLSVDLSIYVCGYKIDFDYHAMTRFALLAHRLRFNHYVTIDYPKCALVHNYESFVSLKVIFYEGKVTVFRFCMFQIENYVIIRFKWFTLVKIRIVL